MTRRFRLDLRINDTLVLSNVMADLEEVARAPENPLGKEAKPDNGPKITENQRRFLFRLLAGQGIDGRQAEAHLRDYFKVKGLGDIPKDQASQYIDQLVRDQKGDGK